MTSKIALLSLLAASAIGVGASSASADWDRPPPGYAGPPSPHRFDPPRYRDRFERHWWHADRERWEWRHRRARWDDRGPPPPPRRDWQYD